MNKLRSLLILGFVSTVTFAADTTYSAPTISVDAVTKTVVAVATALGGIWAFRKVVKTLNKS